MKPAAKAIRRSIVNTLITATLLICADQPALGGEVVPPWKVIHNIPDLIKKAEQGERQAQLTLAELYLQGDETPRNVEKSLELTRKAFDQGSNTAAYQLGCLYANGIGEPRSLSETSLALFLKAAGKGHRDSMQALARRYRQGYGVEKDYLESCKWILLSGQLGFQSSAHSNLLDPRALPTDPELAQIASLLALYKQALSKQSVKAAHQIAEYYEKGTYGPKNPEMAALFKSGRLPTSDAFRVMIQNEAEGTKTIPLGE